jgi:hypothetical protein
MKVVKNTPNTLEEAFLSCLFNEKYNSPDSKNYIEDPDFFNIFRMYIGLQPLSLDNRAQKNERKRAAMEENKC